jgi:cytochrome b561
MAHDRDRYTPPAIALHWLTAALVFVNLGLAWRFGYLEGAERGALIRTHKSIGITVLLLTVLRILWKAIGRRPPSLPLRSWERRLARAVHTGLYVILVAMPLSGWAMISAAAEGRPTLWFGVVPWPRITLIADLPAWRREPLHELLGGTHLALALLLCMLVALHIAAVLKHQLIDGHRQLKRMTP